MTNCLLNLGCDTLRDAAKFSDDELLRYPNFGKKTLAELKHYLAGGTPSDRNLVIYFNRKARERRLLALAQYRDGKTYRQIGEQLGVTRERARQIVIAGERLEKTL